MCKWGMTMFIRLGALSFLKMSWSISRLHKHTRVGQIFNRWLHSAKIVGHNRLGLLVVHGGNSPLSTKGMRDWSSIFVCMLEQLAMIPFGWTATPDHISQLLSRTSNKDWGSAMCGTSFTMSPSSMCVRERCVILVEECNNLPLRWFRNLIVSMWKRCPAVIDSNTQYQ